MKSRSHDGLAATGLLLFEICKKLCSWNCTVCVHVYDTWRFTGYIKPNEMKSQDKHVFTNVSSISALQLYTCPFNHNSFNFGNRQGIHNSGYINLHLP